MLRLPGAGGRFHVHGEGVLAGGLRIIVAEVVEQLFNADRIPRRQLPRGEEPPQVGVRGRIHIDRERGEWRIADREEGIVVDGVVLLGGGGFTSFKTLDTTPCIYN